MFIGSYCCRPADYHRGLMTMIAEDATSTIDLKEKAMFQSVKMLAEMNLPEASRGMFHKFTNTFPQSPRLDQLKDIIATV